MHLKSIIYEILFYGNTSKIARQSMLTQIKKQPNAVQELLHFMFDKNCNVQFLSSVILDDWLINESVLLDEYISIFIEQLPTIENESTKRLASKIALYFVKKRNEKLDSNSEENLFNQCLEWLSQDAKVATEANAMQIITHLCDRYLESSLLIAELIEIKYAEKTPAYQNSAKKLLHKVNKLKAKQITF